MAHTASESTAEGAGRDENKQRFYRELYRERVDFRAVARQDKALEYYLDRHGCLNFHDPAAAMQLTKSLLRVDFGLAVELPPDRLCPPVPSRHVYLQWLQRLLESVGGDGDGHGDGETLGLDIGTGASCIYPLLGCVQQPRWRFVATDIDATNLGYARANVVRNGLQERICVVARRPEDPLLLDGVGAGQLAFVMTNPPFYESADDMAASAQQKKRPPLSACTGAAVEMVCPGGESAFVGRLLAESVLQSGGGRSSATTTSRTWYSAMLGRLASVAATVARLRAAAIDNYAVAELPVPGGARTHRWVVAWSFGARRPAQAVARGLGSLKEVLPPVSEVTVMEWGRAEKRGTGETEAGAETGTRADDAPPPTPGQADAASPPTPGQVAAGLDALLCSLELTAWEWDRASLSGRGRARENVWSRAWRRKKMRATAAGETASAASETPHGTDVALGFLLSIHAGTAATTLRCRWTEGHSEAIFQSFCGFVKTRLQPI